MQKTQNMTSFKQGNIVLVEYPFSERTGSKKRPAFVVSNDFYHHSRQDVIIAGITSNIARKLAGDTVLENWQQAGLKYPSLVTGILQTVKNHMIFSLLGVAYPQDLQKILDNLEAVIK